MRRPSEKTRLLIVIPAWNEEAVLGDVLEAVKAEKPSFADILVVSDGSVDATASIARAAGVAVLDLPLNLGVGGAMRAGFQYARRSGYQYACQLDADGQHDPGEIETLIDTASREGADVVIGSRFAGKGNYEARGPRKWAMNLFSFILSRVCHTRLSDTTSGFKLYGPRALSLFARNYPAEYLGDTIGALVIAARTRVHLHADLAHNQVGTGGDDERTTLALVVSLSRPGEEIATASEVEA